MVSDAPPRLCWQLRPRGAFIAFEEGGLCLALGRGGRGRTRIAYADLTHTGLSARGLWLASRQTTLLIRRKQFERPADAEAFLRALRWKISETPDGSRQLEAMNDVSRRSQQPTSRWVTTVLATLCVAVFGLELYDPVTVSAGAFIPGLVAQGELWRIATANFLHALSVIPTHLIINVLCLLAFGMLVERPLGPIRTLLILAAGGIGSMVGSAVAGYSEVIGASGMVAGLAGAVLSLELHEGEHLPAWWRLPRRLFITVLALQVVIDLALPFVAAGAHVGGFIAGYLVTRPLAANAFDRAPARPLRWAALAVGALVVLSFASVSEILLRDGAALARHGERLLASQLGTPTRLNDLAWRMVTESELEPDDLILATELARVAVEQTDRSDPDLLDTLAETLFASGDRPSAIEVIDEAIFLTHGERYFREQRRRFTGERAGDDRPAPPMLPWELRRRRLEGVLSQPGLSI